MSEQTVNVLFLCRANSARSIMAEAILNRVGAGRFKAYSAGDQPGEAIHDYAVDALQGQNYDIAASHPKSWDEFTKPDAPVMDFVFLLDVDIGEAAPIPDLPGDPVIAHWGIPDPRAAEGKEAVKRAAFAETMKFLNNRIGIFVNLRLKDADRSGLQRRLDELGESPSSAA
jgi:protein-tyrosine-phosphatase